MLQDVAASAAQDDDIDRVVSKVARRLTPLLVAGFFVAYLDRVNISFAALTMNRELALSPQAFGWAAGVFFVGYCLFEAPSNYLLHRIGARVWIARIMVSWGLVSALAAFVWDSASFLALRLLLGIAEAGFAPGVILYLTYWIPAAQRARALGAFLLAVPLSSAIGAPLSTLLLASMDGVAGVSGWRWLFLIEALPSIALGFVCFFMLPERPRDASWLDARERMLLETQLAQEAPAHDEDLWRALRDRRVLTLGAAYFGIVIALYGLGFWLPQIIDALGYGLGAAGLLTAAPFALGAAAMFAWSGRCDRFGEAHAHTARAAVLASLGLAGATAVTSPTYSMIALSLAAIGTLAAMPTFWSLVTRTLSPAQAIVGVAVVNSIGNLAGLVGPAWVGWAKGASGGFAPALLGLAFGPVLTAALIARDARLQAPTPQAPRV